MGVCNLTRSVVGLDIGTTAVRAVELSTAGKAKPTLLRFHEVALDEGAVSRGEVIEPEIVATALKKLWSEGGFKSKNVVLGMGNQHIFARDLTVPKMPLDQIRDSLPFQVQNMLQVPLADSLLDFYPISESVGEHGPMINGLLIAAEKNSILENIRAVERAGLTAVEVDLIPFALNRLLISQPQVKGIVALINVGASTTNILVAQDGVPQFVRIIPAGGDDLTQGLRVGLEIASHRAEELKRSLNLGVVSPVADESGYESSQCTCPLCIEALAPHGDPQAKEILQAVTGELLNGLRNTVKYFTSIRPQDPVEQILICGGGSQLSGFTKALAEMVRIPVITADPFNSITIARKANSEKYPDKASSMAVALGLALRQPA
jgi:type IV pilus assembly protein PilM